MTNHMHVHTEGGFFQK